LVWGVWECGCVCGSEGVCGFMGVWVCGCGVCGVVFSVWCVVCVV
jgi:hypothetical protein